MTEPENIDTLSPGTRFVEALPTAVRWSHALLAPRLRAGDAAVDATAGNGHDTVFLARHVLPGGKVFAFDVQAAAIAATKRQITKYKTQEDGPEADGPEAVTLVHASHHEMERHLPVHLRGTIRAFMFNLGWLPGADKACITRTDTTLQALRIATDWLAESGLITVVCYPGHEGGDAEATAVEGWAAGLAANEFEAQKVAFLNLEGAPPRCVVVRRRPRVTSRTSD